MALTVERMGDMRRTHYCGEFRPENIGQKVTVCGWIQRQRDLGHLIFCDLRDRTGIVQLAFDDKTDEELFQKGVQARAFVLEQKNNVIQAQKILEML